MSLRIIKAGILDTIQDQGRFGYSHLGIHPTGVMDKYASQLANCLLGNDLNSPVIEMHFPAAILEFKSETIICLTGGDLAPTLNGNTCPIYQPLLVPSNSVLQFTRIVSGSRCYLAVAGGVQVEEWLASCSTDLKAQAGGLDGSKLLAGTLIPIKKSAVKRKKVTEKVMLLPWKVNEVEYFKKNTIGILEGLHWNDITYQSKKIVLNESFEISHLSDRMGYKLKGEEIKRNDPKELLSTAVVFGSIQLLPDGQLIILMADHQTTGGYPQIAHVISTDLPVLAQMNPKTQIRFTFTNIETAETRIFRQQQYLQELHSSCKIKMHAFIHDNT
ncbi:MAG TPA: biotin-dependent carboxyltransferase family protein [Flavitalea sp.]|nr:biotin-dependent carboxyltransferase family protein [Flavitalea sp.]